jgi:hypothetical protein
VTSTVVFHCGDVRDALERMPDSSVELAETMHIASEHVDGDTITWTVNPQLPGTRGEHPDQMSLFGEGAA